MATVLYNKTTKEVVAGPFRQGYLVDGKPGTITQPFIELELIETPEPDYDSKTQKLSSEWIVRIAKKTRTLTWTVIEKTIEELELDEEAEAESKNNEINPKILKQVIQFLLDAFTDTQVFEFAAFFPYFKYNEDYRKNNRIQFKGKLYKILKKHTSIKGEHPLNNTINYLEILAK